MNKSFLQFFLLFVFGILLPVNVLSQDKKELFDTFENNMQSKDNLKELQFQVEKSLYLTKSWVLIDKISNTPDKLRLQSIQKEKIPGILKELEKLSEKWDSGRKEDLIYIRTSLTDTLIVMQKYIMKTLDSFEDYEDAFKMFDMVPRVEENGEISVYAGIILVRIKDLQAHFESATEISLDVLKSNCEK